MVIPKNAKVLPKGMIRFQDRTPEEHYKIASAGGRANKNNPRSKFAARLRELKKKGVNSETSKRLYEIMTEKESSTLDILMYLEDIKKSGLKPHEKIQLSKSIMDWHKINHGTKEHDKKVAMAIAVLTPEEKEQEIYRLLGDEEIT
jgi:protein-tyrosine-phosphatase